MREFFGTAGQVDHLIVTASSVRTGTLKDSPLADGEFTFRSKFFGPYLCAKYAQMKPTGSITLSEFFRRAPATTMSCSQELMRLSRRWDVPWRATLLPFG